MGNGDLESTALSCTVKVHVCGLVALGLLGNMIKGQAARKRRMLSPFMCLALVLMSLVKLSQDI